MYKSFRWAVLLATLLLLGLFLIPGEAVKADETTVTFDFSGASSEGWVSTGVNGFGYDWTLDATGWLPPYIFGARDGTIHYDIGEKWIITEVEVCYTSTISSSYNVGVAISGKRSGSFVTDFSASTGISIPGGSPNCSTFTETPGYATYTDGIDDLYAQLYITYDGAGRDGWITSISVTYEDEGGGGPEPGGLIRPFGIDDEDPEKGIYDLNFLELAAPGSTAIFPPHQPLFAYAWASNPDAVVMAAGDGVITNIEPLTGAECSFIGILQPDICIIANPGGTVEDDGVFNAYAASTVNAYKVTLLLSETEEPEELTYWVRDARLYVNVGDEIQGGCIMGKALPVQPILTSNALFAWVLTLTLSNYSLTAPEDPTNQGITLIGETDLYDEVEGGDYAQVIDELGTYANPENACNIDPRFSDCMVNDPELRSGGSEWQSDGNVNWFDVPGVQLLAGGSIGQQLELLPDTSYRVVVSVIPNPRIALGGATGTIRLTLGSESEDFTIQQGDSFQYSMTVIPDPDIAGEFYSLRVRNLGTEEFNLSGVCVGDGQLVGGGCSVHNPGFDFDATGWDLDENVLLTNGIALVPTDAAILQNITLLPGDYRLEVEAFIWNATGWDGTGDISLAATWPGEVDPVLLTVNAQWNLVGNLGYPDLPQILSDTLTISDETTGDLIISPVSASTEDIIGLKISRVCITREDETGGGGIFPSTCSALSNPADDSIGIWISWHWGQLNRFFQCDLMLFLNSQLSVFRSFFNTVSFTGRYFIATVQSGGDWLGKYLFPWANGQFRNIAIGRVTTIVSEGGGCHDLFCAFVEITNTIQLIINTFQAQIAAGLAALINVINVLSSALIGGFNFLFTVVGGVIVFILALIVRMFAVLQSGLGFLGSIITGFNTAPPISIPGLPMCATNPDSSLLCTFVWVTDNTIFTGRWGILFTVILSILAIHLVLWVVGEFKEFLVKLGTTS